jgi:hypothetical protein
MGQVSTLLVILSGAAVLATATPALLRAAGVKPDERTAIRRRAPPSEVALREVRDAVPSSPRLLFDDDDEGVTELSGRAPTGPWPGGYQGTAPQRPSATDDDETFRTGVSLGLSGGRVGLADKPLTLRGEPHETAPAVGTVGAGEALLVRTVTRDWARVTFRDTDGIITGWVPRSGVTIAWP